MLPILCGGVGLDLIEAPRYLLILPTDMRRSLYYVSLLTSLQPSPSPLDSRQPHSAGDTLHAIYP